jgi:hypothetical protein
MTSVGVLRSGIATNRKPTPLRDVAPVSAVVQPAAGSRLRYQHYQHGLAKPLPEAWIEGVREYRK